MARRANRVRGGRRAGVRAMMISTAAAAVAIALPRAARATTYTFNVLGNGNWNVAANWTPAGGPPGTNAADVALINSSNPISRAVTLNASESLTQIQIGNTSGATNTLLQTSAVNLAISDREFVGVGANGNGVYTQSAGTNTVTVYLDLGLDVGSTGTYNLSAGGALVATGSTGNGLYIGDAGNGVFNQTGGSVTIGTPSTAVKMNVGLSTGSSGTYNLTGPGTLTVSGDEIIGVASYGSVVQSAGTNTVGTPTLQANLRVGNSPGSVGFYALSGTGKVQVNGNEYVGNNVTPVSIALGTFTQSGGTNSITGGLFVGSNDSFGQASGVYQINGGGVLSVGGDEHIGYDAVSSSPAVGAVSQNAGTHIVGGNLNLGQSAGTAGSYTLSGTGTLTVNSDENLGWNGLGGVATFTQSGGTNTAQDLYMNAGSVYGLSGSGVLSATLSEVINSSASFSQTGGANFAGHDTTSSGIQVAGGTYALSGGTLNAKGYFVIGQIGTASTVTQTGGTLTIESELLMGGDPSPLATYNLSGTGVVNVIGLGGVNGIVSLGGYSKTGASGAAVFNMSGGTFTDNGIFQIYSTTGTALNLSGGVLTVGSLIGDLSKLNITGGTLNDNDPAGLTLGVSGLPLSMILGGNLNATSLKIPTGATLTLTGGGTAQNIVLQGGSIQASSILAIQTPLSGHGTIVASSFLDNYSTITPSGGTLLLTGGETNYGTVNLSPSGTLQLGTNTFFNQGIINLGDGTVFAGTLNNSSGGVISGPGTINTILTNSASGTIVVPTGPLNITAPLTNLGTIELVGPGASISGTAFTNNGVIRGDGLVVNTMTNGTSGEIRVESGKTITLNSLSANNGKINLQGGTAEFTAALNNSASGQILGQGTLRAPAGFTNNGLVQLTAGADSFFGPITGNSGSKLIVAGNAIATFYDPVTMNSGSEFRVSTGSSAVFFAPVTGANFFTGGGMKDFESGSSLVSQIITAGGSSMVQNSASLTTSVIRENSLEVDGSVAISPDGTAAGTSHLTTLTLLGNGRLDLSNNHLVVTSTPVGAWTGSAYTGLTGALASGRNGSSLPLWDGNGIVTSQSLATTGNYTTLAIARASDVIPSTATATALWSGQQITGADTLVMYTYGGDANLDGKINIDDYIRIDEGISAHLTGWTNGDFNYDGKVNIDDYTQFIDANIGIQGAPFATSDGAMAAGDLQVVAIPEPGGWGGAIMALAFVARARRHRGFHRQPASISAR